MSTNGNIIGNLSSIDPMQLLALCWPEVKIYDKQKEIVYSVIENDETIVPAGNKLGKDFISAFIALYFFISRMPSRVVTTSVDEGQLENVLWGEINWFIQQSRYELPLVVKHLDIRRLTSGGKEDPKSYLIGRVAKKEEGLLGHHLARNHFEFGGPSTLMLYDEASGIENGFKEKTDTWAHRTLIIGNPFQCNNFFKEGVKRGNVPSADNDRKYVNIIRIKAEDSPNVKFAQSQKDQHLKVTGQIIVPGVLTYDEYVKRRKLWDKIRQCISLDAEFYEGSENLLFPPEWLNRAERVDTYNNANFPLKNRVAKGVGVDPGEGSAPTTMCGVDHLGILKMQSILTPDTSIIPRLIKEFCASVKLDISKPDLAQKVFIDLGSGKAHADVLRSQGFDVRTIAFGGSPSYLHKNHYRMSSDDQIQEFEDRQLYKNRRAEMYCEASRLLCPDGKGEYEGFGISAEYVELRRQLAPIPKLQDREGVYWLPPKYKKRVPGEKDSERVKTMEEIIGRSPDDADAFVLAVFAMLEEATEIYAGVM